MKPVGRRSRSAPGEGTPGPPSDLPAFLVAVVRHPIATLGAVLGLTLLAVLALVDFERGGFRIGIDPSISALRSQGDEARAYYDEVRATFGGENALIVALESDDLFTPGALGRLERLTSRLAGLDEVERVLGLANAVDARSVDGELVVDRFLARIPEDGAGLAALRERALTHPLYGETLVARGGRATAVLVGLKELSDAEFLERRVDERVASLVAEHWGPERSWLSGIPMIKAATSQVLSQDLRRLIPACLLVGAVAFALAFRTWRAVWLPTAAIAIGLIWTLATMSLAGHDLNVITAIVPALIMTLAWLYLMYLLASHRHALREDPRGMPAAEVVIAALVDVWRPIAMAAITTVFGFLALAVSPLEQIQEFALYSTVGVVAAWILSMTLAPAVLALGGPGPRPRELVAPEGDRVEALARALGRFDVRRRRPILALTALCALVAGAGATRIRVDQEFVRSFDESLSVRRDFETANAWFGGAVPFYVVLESDAPDGFREPENLAAVRDLQRWLEAQADVGDTTSLADLVGVLYDAVRDVDEAGEALPDARSTVSELLLWVSREDLAPFVDDEFERASVLVRTTATGYAAIQELLDRLAVRLEQLPPALHARVTGEAVLMGDTVEAIAGGQFGSLAAAFASIFLVLVLYLRSARSAALALIPNALPVVFYFGLLGWAGVTLNPATALAGCIVLGVAVDDTIHYIACFRSETARTGDAESAAVTALATVMRPVTHTTVILCLGFLLFTTSARVPLVEFGALSAATMAFAWLMEVTVTPALCAQMPAGTLGRLEPSRLGARAAGFPLFWRLLRRTLFASRGTFARPTAKRVRVMALFVPLLFLLQVIHRIGFALDELFFRGYRRIEVKQPLFLLGIPRSGTTLLQRTLSLDTDNFTAMRLWEIVFAPSITERRLWMALGRLDRALGGFGRRLLVACEERLFGGLREIHPVSLFDAEEDEFVLFGIFSSIFLVFPFPFEEELWHLAFFDTQTPPETRRKIMRFYRRCVQRHLYVHGPDKRFLSKNLAFSPKIDAIRETFPDARIVACMRSPHAAIPSLLSLLGHPWRWFDNDPRGMEFRDFALRLAGHWYRHPMARLPAWPHEQHAFLGFDELTRDPEAAVRELYRRFDLKLGPRFAQALRTESERALGYRSRHSYSLEEFSLTPQAILDGFGDVFERFDFDPEGTRDAAASDSPPLRRRRYSRR